MSLENAPNRCFPAILYFLDSQLMQSNLNTKAERVQLGTVTWTIQNIPSLKLTWYLKLDRWKTWLSFWDGDRNLAGAFAVSFRECFLSKSFLGNITWQYCSSFRRTMGIFFAFPSALQTWRLWRLWSWFCPECQRGDCYRRVVSPLFFGAYGTYEIFWTSTKILIQDT